MTQEEKSLLLKDLSARWPYGVIVDPIDCGKAILVGIKDGGLLLFDTIHKKEYDKPWDIEYIKPYLRPMSSMTEEEQKELSSRYVWKIDINGQIQIRYHSEGSWDDDTDCPTEEYLKLFDWLYKHHLDFRGLIPMGLAIEAPEGMYNIKEK